MGALLGGAWSIFSLNHWAYACLEITVSAFSFTLLTLLNCLSFWDIRGWCTTTHT